MIKKGDVNMFNYLTEEQYKLIEDISYNHDAEFKQWSEENESTLMKWYDENDYRSMGMFDTAAKFAYHCAVKFMEYKSGKVEG